MRNSYFYTFFISLILISLFPATDLRGEEYLFSSIGIADGLAHPSVKCVTRDSKDYLWIGTKSGVTRYDKGKIKTYRIGQSPETGLPDNDILDIFEDRENNIWAICSTGVARYDRGNDTFSTVLIKGKPLRARSYLELPGGILFGGAGSLIFYDHATQKAEQRVTRGGSDRYYTAILPWTHDRYLLSSRWDGIWVYNIKTSRIEPFQGFPGKRITASLIDTDGDLWISDYGSGLYHLDRTGRLTHVDAEGIGKEAIILDLAEAYDKIWIATDGQGLIAYDKASKKAVKINAPEGAPSSLKSINCLYKDRYNYIYAGTVRGGLTSIYPSQMKTIQKTSDFESLAVTSILPDGEKAWLGIDGEGLVLYEPDDADRMTPIPATRGMKVVSLANFDDKRLLISTFDEGLSLFDKESHRLSEAPAWMQQIREENRHSGIPLDVSNLPGHRLAFVTDKVYISDNNGGNLAKYSPAGIQSRLRVFYSDLLNLFFFSEHEIFSIDLEKGNMTSLRKYPDNILECVAFDGVKYLYSGLQDGIERYDLENEKGDRLGKSLPPGASISALAFNEGKLWIGTLGQLFMHDTATGKSRGFGINEGVSPNEFIYKAIFATPFKLLMGGMNGLLKINLGQPGHENSHVKKSPLRLGEVLVDGLPISLDGTTAHLPDTYTTLGIRINGGNTHLMEKEPVKFYFGHNNLETSIETTDNVLTLGHLQDSQGGRYDIFASIRGHDGTWDEPQHVGTIYVPVAWWRRPLTIIVASILFLVLAITAVAYYISHRRHKQTFLREESKRQSLEKEVGFLINLNYELRTPLTLIYSRLRMLLDNMNEKELPRDKMLEELESIYRNSDKMRDIINSTVELWRSGEIKEVEPSENALLSNVSSKKPEKIEDIEETPEEISRSEISRLTAIVVEDDTELRELLVSSLSAIFKRVLEAANGKEALTMIKNSNPDLIITEARLPEMSGVELCREIKQTKNYSHIPVIMLTTRLEELSIANGNNYGADNYLTKPFDIGVLEKRCFSVLKSFDRVKQWYRSQASDVLPTDRRHTNDAETFILKVKEIIEHNIGKPGFGVEDVVNQMLVSRSTLYGKFKDLTGQSLGNYINDYKLNRAKEMLSTTTMSMVDISDALGFTTQRYFSTFFKERTGMTPTAYREAPVPVTGA